MIPAPLWCHSFQGPSFPETLWPWKRGEEKRFNLSFVHSRLSMPPSTGHHAPCGTNERKKMDACMCTFNGQTQLWENISSNELFEQLQKIQQISVAVPKLQLVSSQRVATSGFGAAILSAVSQPEWWMYPITAPFDFDYLISWLPLAKGRRRNRLQVNTRRQAGRWRAGRQTDTRRMRQVERRRLPANTQTHKMLRTFHFTQHCKRIADGLHCVHHQPMHWS